MRWQIAAWAFALALAMFVVGLELAARLFPNPPYDWMYSVVSELASRKHNPQGGRWFSVGLGLSMLALWPVVSYLRDTVGERRWPIFAGLYTGLLGLYGQRLRRGWTGALIVAAPLAAIAVTQVALYFDQRDLGWVDRRWRDLGVSLWLSFAFWQWLAVALLWIGLGHLLWSSRYAQVSMSEPARARIQP